MADAKTMHVRNMRTDEIREVTPEQRELQDKTVWVPVTGVKPKDATAEPDAGGTSDEPDAGASKTTSKATPPKK